MDDANIDAMTMWLLKNPFNYDVLVAPNLYGDIISDLCAQMVGGLGFGCSGNIGEKLAVFEPTHGSAPKYAGQYKVNPIATILAAKMMLDWLGETRRARARGRRRSGHRRRKGPHLRHGRLGDDARDGRSVAGCRLMSRCTGRWPVRRVGRADPTGRGSMDAIVIHEVGPRDGLQVEKQVVPTGAKIAWIEQLIESGVDVVQLGSFVNPERVPQMADTDELFRTSTRRERKPKKTRSRRSCSTRRGSTAAWPAASSSSAWASRRATRTAGRTPAWAPTRRRRIVAWRRARAGRGRDGPGVGAVGLRLRLRGDVPEERVLDIVRRYLDAGL
jgi:hypothetical protein